MEIFVYQKTAINRWNKRNFIQRVIYWIFLLSFLLLTTACSRDNDALINDEMVNKYLLPDAKIILSEEPGEIVIALGYKNLSDEYIPEIDNFQGDWILLRSNGEPRARGTVLTAGPFDSHETVYPLEWRAILDPDTYTLTWAAPSMGTVMVQFQVIEEGSGIGVVMIRKETSETFLINNINKPID